MTNNAINNVPRELLEEVMLAAQRMPVRGPSIRAKLHALLSAPSPAGVDGLNTDRNAAFKACPESGCDWGSFYLGWKARGEVEQSIIDGLRGEVADLGSMLATVSKAGLRVRTERDQHAQRIGELEGLLRSCLPALSDGGCAALANRIAATLSVGKEGE